MIQMYIQEGIKHIEDVKVEKFLNIVEKIIEQINKDNNIDISVKVDGIQNISFSVILGKLYQQRISKGQQILKSNPNDWPKDYIYNEIRQQHTFMQLAFKDPILKNIFFKKEMYFNKDKNYSFECEILPQKVGNSIVYTNDTSNLIFIRSMQSRVILNNQDYDTIKLEDSRFLKMVEELYQQDKTIEFELIKYTTEDTDKGVILKEFKSEEKWKFERVKHIDLKKDFKDKNNISRIIQGKLDQLKQYIYQKSSYIPELLNIDIINMNANKVSLINREEFKKNKADIMDKVYIYAKDIKNELLNINLYIEKELYNDNDIEGLVVRDGDDLYKIVDRQYFTKLNKFIWDYLEQQKNVLDNFKIELKNIILPNSYTGTFLNYIKNINSYDIKKNLFEFCKHLNQNDTQNMLYNIDTQQDKSIQKINRLLQEFKDKYNVGDLKLTLKKQQSYSQQQEKEFSHSQEQFDRFKVSLVGEKIIYQTIKKIITLKEQNVIKLIAILSVVFLKIDFNNNDLENVITRIEYYL